MNAPRNRALVDSNARTNENNRIKKQEMSAAQMGACAKSIARPQIVRRARQGAVYVFVDNGYSLWRLPPLPTKKMPHRQRRLCA